MLARKSPKRSRLGPDSTRFSRIFPWISRIFPRITICRSSLWRSYVKAVATRAPRNEVRESENGAWYQRRSWNVLVQHLQACPRSPPPQPNTRPATNVEGDGDGEMGHDTVSPAGVSVLVWQATDPTAEAFPASPR